MGGPEVWRPVDLWRAIAETGGDVLNETRRSKIRAKKNRMEGKMPQGPHDEKKQRQSIPSLTAPVCVRCPLGVTSGGGLEGKRADVLPRSP